MHLAHASVPGYVRSAQTVHMAVLGRADNHELILTYTLVASVITHVIEQLYIGCHRKVIPGIHP